jgi:hypothetical protein
MPPKLKSGEATGKIEVKVPTSLKEQVKIAAQKHGDGDVANWVRSLLRAEVQRLGIEVPEAETAKTRVPKPRRR